MALSIVDLRAHEHAHRHAAEADAVGARIPLEERQSGGHDATPGLGCDRLTASGQGADLQGALESISCGAGFTYPLRDVPGIELRSLDELYDLGFTGTMNFGIRIHYDRILAHEQQTGQNV